MNASRREDIYGGADPGDAPAYSLTESARYLTVPRATLRCWFFGQAYPTRGERRRSQPVIVPADAGDGLLSFRNLVEAHVLSSLRTIHSIPLPRIRKAIDYLRKTTQTERPLIDVSLRVDGGKLFAQAFEGLLNLSAPGQMVLHGVIAEYLRRVEEEDDKVVRFYPFTRKRELSNPAVLRDQPKFVVITPRFGFGRPILAGTNIRTSVIAERYLAGESVADLAADYARSLGEVEEAIRSEFPAAA